MWILINKIDQSKIIRIYDIESLQNTLSLINSENIHTWEIKSSVEEKSDNKNERRVQSLKKDTASLSNKEINKRLSKRLKKELKVILVSNSKVIKTKTNCVSTGGFSIKEQIPDDFKKDCQIVISQEGGKNNILLKSNFIETNKGLSRFKFSEVDEKSLDMLKQIAS